MPLGTHAAEEAGTCRIGSCYRKERWQDGKDGSWFLPSKRRQAHGHHPHGFIVSRSTWRRHLHISHPIPQAASLATALLRVPNHVEFRDSGDARLGQAIDRPPPHAAAMAEEELQAKLRELDHELEEGDITKKGYPRLGAALGERPKTDTRQIRKAPDASAVAVLRPWRLGRRLVGRPLAYCLAGQHLCRPLRYRRQLQQCSRRRRPYRLALPRPFHAC
jgi:hypothetical protein